MDEDGTKTTRFYTKIRINERGDAQKCLAKIKVFQSPEEQFDLEFARVTDLDGNRLRKLRRKDVKTRSAFSRSTFYQDNMIQEFELMWNTYPYILEYAYTKETDEYLSVTRWTPLNYCDVPTVQATLKVITPPGLDLNIYASDKLTQQVNKLEDQVIYTWKSESPKDRKSQILAPPKQEWIPKVFITPTSFKLGVEGTAASWADFGKWYADLNRGMDELPETEITNIKKLTEGLQDTTEIVSKIYHYLQDHTRYINVSIEEGGLKSYPASYVCDNKYGDCKALTTYMKAMLKSLGIQSHYAIINAGNNAVRVQPDVPGSQFNHVILAVPMANDTLWLENTSNSNPFNYLGTFTQNRQTLLVDDENSRLVKTPQLTPADVLDYKKITYFKNEQGEYQLAADLVLRSKLAGRARYAHKNGKDDMLRDVMDKSVGLTSFKPKRHKIKTIGRESDSVVFSVLGPVKSPLRKIGKWKVINPLHIALPDFEKPEERYLPVRFSYPVNTVRVNYYPLDILGTGEMQLPENTSFESQYGSYVARFEQTENTLKVREQLSLNAMDIKLDDYQAFFSFIQKIRKFKNQAAVLIAD